MTTHDTPEAALAAVVKAEEWRLANHPDDHWHEYGVADEFGPPSSGKCVPMLQVIRSLNAILAALPPGWCGHDTTHRERCHNYDPDAVIAHLHEAHDKAEAEIARLRAAMEWHLANPNRPNEGHQRLRAALAPSEP